MPSATPRTICLVKIEFSIFYDFDFRFASRLLCIDLNGAVLHIISFLSDSFVINATVVVHVL